MLAVRYSIWDTTLFSLKDLQHNYININDVYRIRVVMISLSWFRRRVMAKRPAAVDSVVLDANSGYESCLKCINICCQVTLYLVKLLCQHIIYIYIPVLNIVASKITNS